MTGLDGISAIGADTSYLFIAGNLVQPLGQCGFITNAVVGYLHGPDLQRGGINAEMNLAP